MSSSPSQPQLKFPVTCPTCHTQHWTTFNAADLAAALITGHGIPLHAPCHGRTWIATGEEVRRIRDYLGNSPLSA